MSKRWLVGAAGIVAVASILIASGCTEGSWTTVQHTVSPDGQFRADVAVNRGSALQHDWYVVVVGKTYPGWLAILPRQRWASMCASRAGKVTVAWSGPHELLVTCTGCKKEDLDIFRETWNGVHAKYLLE
jgi:hypothetical protein